jgi:predicted Fe-Mo cluster-binding NifX family protein
MRKKMKIAIPTDDGLVVGKQFLGSRGFLVATIESGKIVHKELRWNLLSEMMTSEHGSLYNLCDCDTVIVYEIGPCQCQRLKAEKKEVIQTLESKINKVFGEYLNRGRSNFISL